MTAINSPLAPPSLLPPLSAGSAVLLSAGVAVLLSAGAALLLSVGATVLLSRGAVVLLPGGAVVLLSGGAVVLLPGDAVVLLPEGAVVLLPEDAVVLLPGGGVVLSPGVFSPLLSGVGVAEAGICSKIALIVTSEDGMVNIPFETVKPPLTTCHSLNLYPLFALVVSDMAVPAFADAGLAAAVPLPSLRTFTAYAEGGKSL
jgi:hypothetical protein